MENELILKTTVLRCLISKQFTLLILQFN